MNKLIYAVLGLVVVGAIGVALVISGGSDEDVAMNDEVNSSQPADTTDSATEPVDGAEATSEPVAQGQLVDYSREALFNSTTENNLLFFHATWCTVCNSVERAIEAGTIPENLTIFKVNYDSDTGQQLAEEHRIPIQYTMVQVDPNGEAVTQWVNQFGDGIDQIVANLQ